MRFLVFGDSIAAGAWDEEGGWATRLGNYLTKIVLASQFATYAEVYNSSISGEDSRKLLKRFERELVVRLDGSDSCIALIAIGTNDSIVYLENQTTQVPLDEYQKNISELAKICSTYRVTPIFIGMFAINEKLVNPMPWYENHAYTLESIKQYNDTLRKFTEEKEIDFINLLDEVGDGYDLLTDGVHSNSKGHKKMFEIIKSYLQKIGKIE